MKTALGRSVVASMGFAGLYVVLALVSPTTTFHLGPAVVSAAGPIAAGRGQGPWPTLTGLGVAMGAVWLLHRLDLLAGPSLLPAGGALLESVVAAIAGALVSPIILAMISLMERSEPDQA